MISRKIGIVEIMINENKSNAVYFKKKDLSSAKNDLSKIKDITSFLYEKNGPGPYSVVWEFTNVCNFNCQYCYIKNTVKSKIDSIDFYYDLIDKFVDNGMIFCKMTGGEVMLFPYFREVYLYLKQKGVLVAVYTNGSLLDEKTFQLLEKYPPFNVEVTLYGYSEEKYNCITRADDKRNTVYSNIIRMYNSGIKVICKSVISKLISDEFYQIHSWCIENRIEFYYSVDIFDSYSGEARHSFNISDDEKVKYLQPLLDSEISYDTIEKQQKRYFSCGAGKVGIYVSYDKKIYPCMSMHGIKQFEYSLMDVSDSLSKMEDDINYYSEKPVSICKGCNASIICKECIVSDFIGRKHPCSFYQKLADCKSCPTP